MHSWHEDNKHIVVQAPESQHHHHLHRQGTRDEHDQSVLGLALYAISSCFLATTLVFTKKLGQSAICCWCTPRRKSVAHCPTVFAASWHMPVFEILIARSATIAVFALGGCAICRVNPFGNR